MELLWLLAAALLAAAAYLVGWPAWTGYRARESRDLNAERYLAWRGRAPRGPRPSTLEGMTRRERQRLWLGAALGAGALVCLAGFFAAT
ncbi:MAG: hypothetical protein ACRDHD_01560 [Candidatus Limnocylindria bacterium]